ncbi:MAG: hypothetical protein CSYNP_01144 [Syntrophus sp. SKADARSKE-3]|nr:hypothetical protein [Syntrophus sp. SKADARSKE-3]
MRSEDSFIEDTLFSPFSGRGKTHIHIDNPDEQHTLLDWTYLLDRLKREGIATVFYQQLQKQNKGHILPSEVNNSLKQLSISILSQNLAAIGEAKKVFGRFQDKRIPLVVLKGLYMLEHIYPHLAMRGISDIDILIHKEDIFTVDDCLNELGYEPLDGTPEIAVNNPPGYLSSLDYFHCSGRTLRFHIHWHLVNTSVPAYMFAPLIDLDYIWHKTIQAKIADVDVQILCPEHNLLYLCEHALRVGHSFDRMILVYDIVLFLKAHCHLDWTAVWKEGERLHMERFLFLSMSIVERIAGIGMPDYIRESFYDKHRLRWGEEVFLAIHKEKRRFRGSSYLIYLSMNRTPAAFFLFLFRTVFPPEAIIRQRSYTRKSQNKIGKIALYRRRISEILLHLCQPRDFLHNNKS